MISLGPIETTLPNLARLGFVPVFLWAAWRDYQTRRVPNKTWVPLLAVGLALFANDIWAAWNAGFPVYDTIQLVLGGLFLPVLSLFLWANNLFGGADAKALIVIGFAFTTYPTYYLPRVALPVVTPTLDIFAFTVFTNAALIGLAYPTLLALNNAARHTPPRLSAYAARKRSVTALPRLHGRLVETDPQHDRNGLDIDVLRMYLQWRGITLEDLREAPDQYRATEPDTTYAPGDGVVTDGGQPQITDPAPTEATEAGTAPQTADEITDAWGVDAFLEDAEMTYGMDAPTIRRGLETIAENESVWVSPGLPFFLPLTAGMLIALTYGDLAIAALSTVV